MLLINVKLTIWYNKHPGSMTAALQQFPGACGNTHRQGHPSWADRQTCHSLAQLCGPACAHPHHPYAHCLDIPHFHGSPHWHPYETCGPGPGLHQPCPWPLSNAGLPLRWLCGPCTSPQQHDILRTAVYVRQAAMTRSVAALSIALALNPL